MMLSTEAAAWLKAASGTFTGTLAGLAFETIPFLLMGTLLSALIQAFVPDRALKRLFPRNRYLSILVALFIGALVPICECGTVPLARRLRQKGLPLSTAAAFLLAAPLANPMTVISTFVAFRGTGHPMFIARLGLGLASAFIIAIIVEFTAGKRPSSDIRGRHGQAPESRFTRLGAAAIPAPPRLPAQGPRRDGGSRSSLADRIAATLEHASYDFLDSGRYLVAGITIAAMARALIPTRAILRSLGSPLAATGTGLLSAYVLSLCSSADAFVARSVFAPSSYAAVQAFLVLGPMIDLKNTVLLSRFVRPRRLAAFVAIVAAVVGAVTLTAGLLAEAL
jgi:uncharacterized protein